jgi:hypothetical protein
MAHFHPECLKCGEGVNQSNHLIIQDHCWKWPVHKTLVGSIDTYT